jgi:hypothetical protein
MPTLADLFSALTAPSASAPIYGVPQGPPRSQAPAPLGMFAPYVNALVDVVRGATIGAQGAADSPYAKGAELTMAALPLLGGMKTLKQVAGVADDVTRAVKTVKNLPPGPFGIDTKAVLMPDEDIWRQLRKWVSHSGKPADRDALIGLFQQRPEMLQQIREGLRAKWGDELTLYRGTTGQESGAITSWTLDPARAESFRNRYGGQVITAKIRPEDIVGIGSMMEGEVFAPTRLDADVYLPKYRYQGQE